MSLLQLPIRFDCACGATHTCDIRQVVCGAGALAQVPALLTDCRALTVVSDGNTGPLAADALAETLAAAGHRVRRAHFAGRQVLTPDEGAIAHIEAALPPDTAALVGVGSGVINDLCKYVAAKHGLPYLIAATAPSMDGYASKGAAMTLGGMKVTVPAPPPAWIVGDDGLLATAPLPMLQSGIGDLVGKYSCLNDWQLAAQLTGEHFCPYIHDQVLAAADATAEDIPAVLARQPAAVGRLFAHLVEVGVAMSLAGNSRPASGSEHHLAHFYEITGLQRGRPCLLHGIDVAYGSLATALLRQMLAGWLAEEGEGPAAAGCGAQAGTPAAPCPECGAAREEVPAEIASCPAGDAAQEGESCAAPAGTPAAHWPAGRTGPYDPDARLAAWRRVYGELAPSVAQLQQGTGFYTPQALAGRLAALRQRRSAVAALLAQAPGPARMTALLQSIGLAPADYLAAYGPAVIEESLVYAKDLKDRYTLLNLLDDLGLLPAFAARAAAALRAAG